MDFMNKSNGKVFRHLTAREIAYLAVEGVDVWTTGICWKRINRRLNKMGLRLPSAPTYINDIVTWMAIDIVIQEAENDLQKEVDSFIVDMQIMGMLDDDDDDEEEE